MKIYFIAAVFLCLTGCATVLKGPKSALRLKSYPDSIRVFGRDGREFAVRDELEEDESKFRMGSNEKVFRSVGKFIALDVRHEDILIFKSGEKSYTITPTPYAAAGWVLADLFLTPLWGLIIDGATGNFMEFEPVVLPPLSEFSAESKPLVTPKSATSTGRTTVYLKTGSILRGKMIELSAGTSLKIRTDDGIIHSHQWDEIARYEYE